ncbi:MAG TPA: LamG-like jellyroll fold domain-containing protein [Mycobacteriales bacterium]|nr:LamG-like jellyroll fold domain-containing protein [Mycobacteriales bacterium]
MRRQRVAARLILIVALAAGGLLLPVRPATAAIRVPTGFADVTVVAGLIQPTAVAFAADGRLFVAEKSGLIKVFDSLTDPTPAIVADLRTQTHNYWDRGLLGLALDPAFPSRPYLYAFYTYDAEPGGTEPRWGTPGATSDGCPNPPGATSDGCVVQARLVRLTITGDVAIGPEQVLVTGWCQQFPSHSVGTVAFGPDGALYASAGEGSSFLYADWGEQGNRCADPPGPAGTNLAPPTAAGGALRAQSVRRAAGQPVLLSGSIIRVDPDTGAGLPGNPFYASSDPNARRIIAYGMRSPFRIGARPGTRQLWVADVGWSSWEEIDRIPDMTDGIAENFGWPCYEGNLRQPSYDAANLNLCESLYTGPGQTAPYYRYHHDTPVVRGDNCGTGSSSITGIAFEDGSSYPASYRGALFFADSSRGCVWAMRRGSNGAPDPAQITRFVAGGDQPVQLVVGPGGDLFWVELSTGTLHRIIYTGANHLPTATISADRYGGPVPLTVQFDGTGSSDLDGDPLRYAWDLDADGQFDDGDTATPTFSYAEPGPVRVRLRVTDPAGGSDVGSVLISPGPPNTPPAPVIDTPTGAARWRVGDPIVFAGHADDAEDGALGADRLSWSVVLYHCPSNCHTHPVQEFSGVTSGTLPAPDHEYPSYLLLTLTATDSAGVAASTSVRLDPRTVDVTLASAPPGLRLTRFSGTVTAPSTETVIVGSTAGIGAPSPQTLGGTSYEFVSWSDGGSAAHNIVAGATPTTYTATYRVVPPGLVAAYPFNQGSGGSAADASGHQHAGTLTGGVTWTESGRYGGALSFDGTSGMVTVPDTTDLRLATGFTIEAWVRPTGVTGRRTVVFKDRAGGLAYALYAGSNNSRPQGYAYLGGAERAVTGPTALPLNTWTHLAVSYDGSLLRIYQNGTQVSTHAASGPVPSLPGALEIGANTRWNERFAGRLDEIRIYNRALSAAEIRSDRDQPIS